MDRRPADTHIYLADFTDERRFFLKVIGENLCNQ